MKLISAKDAAKKLGVSDRRIRSLISAGKLPATLIGNAYVIQESDLSLVKERQTGRPKKEATKE